MILMLNRTEFIEAMLATNLLGAIAVPVNFRLTPPELAFLVGNCQSRIVITEPMLAPVATAVRNLDPLPGQDIEIVVAEGPTDDGLLGYEELLAAKDAPAALVGFAAIASTAAAEQRRRDGTLDAAVEAYGRALARYDQADAADPSTKAANDPAVALVLAGRARVAYQQGDDARQRRLAVGHGDLAGVAARAERLPVQRPPDLRLQIGIGIKRVWAVVRPDTAQPVPQRQLDAELAVKLRPALQHGAFRVHDQAVKIED